jgi:phage terminase large subunit
MTTPPVSRPSGFQRKRRSTRPDNNPDAPKAVMTEADLFRIWRTDPEVCIQQAIIDPYNAATKQGIVMTTQQREAIRSVRAVIAAKLAVHRGDATAEQQELAKKIGVSIMAGKGIGKDTLVSWLLLWFVWAHPYCKVPCTSVSADQLEKVLWSELAKWLPTSYLAPFLKLQSGKLFYTMLEPDVVGKRWFAYTKTANPNSTELEPEGVAGAHEDYVMVVVDEASGVNDAIFQSLEGTLTQMVNFMVMIFNPTRSKGYAIDSQEAKAHRWITHRWNAEDSEIGNRDLHQRLLEDYGRDSNPYRIRVLGLPPLTDAQTLIPWDWIKDAIDRELVGYERYPLVKGVDCGAGGDQSIIVTERGGHVYPLKRLTTPDSTILVGWVGNDLDGDHPDAVEIDTIGIGWHVEGHLRQQKGGIIHAADARRTADNPDKYLNKRAEMYDRLREKFERGTISIPNDVDLIDQLSVVRCEYTGSKMKILEKKKLKKLTKDGRSPDEADALALTCYRHPRFLSRSTRPVMQPPVRDYGAQAWLRA